MMNGLVALLDSGIGGGRIRKEDRGWHGVEWWAGVRHGHFEL